MATSRISHTTKTTDHAVSAPRTAPRGTTVLPRRALPSSRAIIGGLLVALAAVGIFVAQDRRREPAPTRYLTARHDLVPGQRLTPADLVASPANLPGALARRAYQRATALRGAVVLAPIHAGELVQQGQVADADRWPGRNQVSFAAEAARAVAGALAPGDHIAIVISNGAGTTPTVAATDLEVLAIDRRTGSFEGAGRLTITVAATPQQVLGVARATTADRITVVRTTGTVGDDQLRVTAEAAS